ncbi:MAG TPA: glycosyltransferase family 4 protein [Solirubrobacteraceae bacterium]|nr:glycosyltransferase family 4 protein [Solirubrobacteraceae bacterium]
MSGAVSTVRVAGPHAYPLAPGSDVGGEVYERMLLERLPSHGIELIVGVPGDHRALGLPEGVRVEVIGHRLGLHWTRAPLRFTPWVVRLLRAGGIDVLRAHSVRHVGPSLLLGRALARSRVPVVIHHHHFFPRWARLEAAILRRADAVITVSEFSRAELVRAGVLVARIHVVRDGIARPPRTAGWPAAWPAGDGLRLLELGRLEPRKRPELGIDTLAQLRHTGAPVSLVIAGDGPMAGELAARASAAGVGERVRLLGRVSEQDKWRLLDTADVLLFGSTLEGFGLVVAEAQSRGVPVVAAAGTATVEALDPGRSGVLVEPTAVAFAAAVASLADGQRRAAMGAAAREFAARFDWDRCASEVAGVYRTVAGAR